MFLVIIMKGPSQSGYLCCHQIQTHLTCHVIHLVMNTSDRVNAVGAAVVLCVLGSHKQSCTSHNQL